MKKFKAIPSGKVYNEGDLVKVSITKKVNGKVEGAFGLIPLIEPFIESLKKANLVEEIIPKKTSKQEQSITTLTIAKVIASIAHKRHLSYDATCGILKLASQIHTASMMALILFEASLMLDEQYEGHIKNTPILYTINLTGFIADIDTKLVPNVWKYYPVFRNKKDAEIAFKLYKEIHNELFK